ncbi:Uncharacterised protein [Chlamydia trachomatis]|nr:Uncharacterised protein [Chlamydia trachomatis]
MAALLATISGANTPEKVIIKTMPTKPISIIIDMATFFTNKTVFVSFKTVYLATIVAIANGNPAVNTFKT